MSYGINLLAIGVVVIGLLTVCWHLGTVYKGMFVNILESFFMVNLGVLVTATSFARSSPDPFPERQLAIVSALMSLSFVVFWIIMAYHVHKEFISKKLSLDLFSTACKTFFQSRRNIQQHENHELLAQGENQGNSWHAHKLSPR